MEPEEEPGRDVLREFYEEAGVKGKLGQAPGKSEPRTSSYWSVPGEHAQHARPGPTDARFRA
ncbi:hypothetical protein GH733_014825 [Mirounga leonina]|nr:hypothetical protein GH733_014825 [Mirounga leonina]